MAFNPNTAIGRTGSSTMRPKNKYYDKEKSKWTSKEGVESSKTNGNGENSGDKVESDKYHGNRFSLPYGLCEGLGISTDGMTPREAWDAYMNATGKSKNQAEQEHWGKEADEKNAQKNHASGEKNKENELNATNEQRKIIDKFSERLAIGKNGTMKYGGDQATIVEAPTFSKLENGDIEYRIVGVREIPAQKSDVIGVGDTKARTRTTISTGIIKQDGLIINNRNEVTEETGVKAEKQPAQTKEMPTVDKLSKQSEKSSINENQSENTETQTSSLGQTEKNIRGNYKSFRGNINEGVAKRAKELTSWDDYKNGSATNSYNSDISIFEQEVNKLFEKYKDNDTLSDNDWERARNIADQYGKNLADFTNKYNSIEGSYPSWFISGASGYNNARHEKKMNRLDSLFSKNDRTLDPTDNVYLDRIKGILSNRSIAAGDENAIGKLQKKYDDLKAELENGKAMNAYFRKNKTLVGFPGISEESAKAFDAKNATGDYFASQPFAAYRLQNGNAELHRIQGRIEQLKKAQSAAAEAKANPEAAEAKTAAKYPHVNGVRVVENADLMRVQLKFDGRPDRETIDKLKHNGFRWSPSQGAWQRQLNSNGEYATKRILEELKKEQENG